MARTRKRGVDLKPHRILSLTLGFLATLGLSATDAGALDIPCSPQSEFLDRGESQVDPEFCAAWNPEFGLRGASCCPKPVIKRSRRRSKGSCGPKRAKASYCDEMTEEQRAYWAAVLGAPAAGGSSRVVASEWVPEGAADRTIPTDVLDILKRESGRSGTQSFCGVSNGFLAYGRPVLGTAANRLLVKNPERCVNFGTDPLVGMLEWTGRRVAETYADPAYRGARIVVGNVSAPKGGCLAGRSGGRGHASHTSGRDVDLAFFDARPGREASEHFFTGFDPKANWWMIRELFKNPYGCVQVMFLDKRHIRKLGKYASRHDPEGWLELRRHIQHVRGHRNHLHVRVGTAPGAPGCPASPIDAEDEDEDVAGSVSGVEHAAR